MRVPVYQQQVTPQIPSVRTQVQVPDGATGVAVKPIDTTAGIAQGVESLRLGIMKLQENKEQFELAQSVTEFRRRNTEFLNAKDTGIFAQQGKNVFGSTERYTKFATDLAEELAKNRKWSGPARQRFMSAIDNVVNYSTQSVMRFEQDASEKVKNAVFEGTIAQAYQDASMNVRNDALFRDALDTAVSASVERWAPFGQEKVAAEIKKLESQFYAMRIASILQDDPRAAQAMFEKNRNALLPDMQVRLESSIKRDLELIEAQEMGDQLARRFGTNLGAGLAFIRKNFEGDKERQYVAEFKTRVSELKQRQSEARAAAANGQIKFANNVVSQMRKGRVFSDNEMQNWVANGQINEQLFDWLKAKQNEQMMRPKFEAGLRVEYAKKGENFDMLAPEARENAVQEKAWTLFMGEPQATWKEKRDATVAALNYGYMMGNVTPDTYDSYVKRGLASKADYERAVNETKKFRGAQKKWVSSLETQLNNFIKDPRVKSEGIDTRPLMTIFQTKIDNIDPNASDWAQQTSDAAHAAMLQVAKQNGAPLKQFFGLMDTRLGDIIEDIETSQKGAFIPDISAPFVPQGSAARAQGQNAQKEVQDKAARKKLLKETLKTQQTGQEKKDGK